MGTLLNVKKKKRKRIDKKGVLYEKIHNKHRKIITK